jgi:two-component system response regulator RegX3
MQQFPMAGTWVILILLGLVKSGLETQAAVWVPTHDRPITSPTLAQVDAGGLYDLMSVEFSLRRSVLSLSTTSTDLIQSMVIPPHEPAAVTRNSLFGIDLDTRRSTFNLIPQERPGDGPLHLPVDGVNMGSRAPVVPVAPTPSAGLLFALLVIGLFSVPLRERQTRVLSGSDTESMTGQHPSESHCLLLLSADSVFVHDVRELVHHAGYPTHVTADVTETLAISQRMSLALLLVDRRVPDWDILRTSSSLKCVPLITLVPAGIRCTEAQWISDLERGADSTYDFLDGGRLFLAKLRASLRRAGCAVTSRAVYHVGAVHLDADRREVTIAGERLQLSDKPFVLLKTLMQAPARVFRRSELVDRVWGPRFAIGKHTLDVHVHTLRRHLDRDPRRRCRLITIKGVGFKLKTADPVPTSAAMAIDGCVDPLFADHSALRKWSRL